MVAVQFPVLRTGVLSTRAPNMILSLKYSLSYWLRHLWPDFFITSIEQELRAAVGLTVSDICSQLKTELGLDFSPEVVAALTALTVEKNKRSAEDLEAFAQHAKRSTINVEDVKLLTRRNAALVTIRRSMDSPSDFQLSSE